MHTHVNVKAKIGEKKVIDIISGVVSKRWRHHFAVRQRHIYIYTSNLCLTPANCAAIGDFYIVIVIISKPISNLIKSYYSLCRM